MGAAPPKAATDYDVVVIGSGVGGTRLDVGCIPSKALLHASRCSTGRTKFAGFGIKVDLSSIRPTMMVRKQASVDALRHGIEFLFRKNKSIGSMPAPACRAGQGPGAQPTARISADRGT